jgi:hypothetical protein
LTIRLIGLDLNRETIRIAQAVTDDADEIGYCASHSDSVLRRDKSRGVLLC